jgi:hypothetical protein
MQKIFPIVSSGQSEIGKTSIGTPAPPLPTLQGLRSLVAPAD